MTLEDNFSKLFFFYSARIHSSMRLTLILHLISVNAVLHFLPVEKQRHGWPNVQRVNVMNRNRVYRWSLDVQESCCQDFHIFVLHSIKHLTKTIQNLIWCLMAKCCFLPGSILTLGYLGLCRFSSRSSLFFPSMFSEFQNQENPAERFTCQQETPADVERGGVKQLYIRLMLALVASSEAGSHVK